MGLKGVSFEVKPKFTFLCEPGSINSLVLGDGRPPTFSREWPFGYINPYYWVDDHPLLYGNKGGLDPIAHVVRGWILILKAAEVEKIAWKNGTKTCFQGLRNLILKQHFLRKSYPIILLNHDQLQHRIKIINPTTDDGRNPAPPEIYKTL